MHTKPDPLKWIIVAVPFLALIAAFAVIEPDRPIASTQQRIEVVGLECLAGGVLLHLLFESLVRKGDQV